MSEATKCEWCGQMIGIPCMNTRDMTDRAIEGEAACYYALREAGGGEHGMKYVDANRSAAGPGGRGSELCRRQDSRGST